MAHAKSAKKRIRQDARKRVHNHYYKKTTRTLVAKLRRMEDKKTAESLLRRVTQLIDKLVKKNLWHKNKAANVKSKLARHVNSLG